MEKEKEKDPKVEDPKNEGMKPEDQEKKESRDPKCGDGGDPLPGEGTNGPN